ncbi:unnamed protein product, partial [Didymodactylos carnosus]
MPTEKLGSKRNTSCITNQTTTVTQQDDNKSENSDISEDEVTTSTRSKFNNANPSPVFEYAEPITPNDFQCKLCSKHYRCGTGTTANICKHLANSHGITRLLYKSQKTSASVIPNETKKLFDDAAIRCIVKDSRPFNDFRRPGMQLFMKEGIPGYRGPHSRTVRRRLLSLYTMIQNDTKSQAKA